MNQTEINISAMLAERTLANIGLTPAAVRAMTAHVPIVGNLIGNPRNIKRNVIRHEARAAFHASSAHVATSQAIRARLNALKKRDFGAVARVWKHAGFQYDVVSKLMTGEQATMRPERIAKLTASLDALYPESQ